MVKCSHCLLYVFCVTLVFSSYYFLFQIVINYLLLRILNNYFFSNYLFVLMYLFLLFLLVIDLFVITIPPIRILCPHKTYVTIMGRDTSFISSFARYLVFGILSAHFCYSSFNIQLFTISFLFSYC